MKKPKLTPGRLCRDKASGPTEIVFFPIDAKPNLHGGHWIAKNYLYFDQPYWRFKTFRRKYDCDFEIRPGEKVEIEIEL